MALSRSFADGHIPSASEISGSWVLTGFWLYPNSKPDLNCDGIMRGKVFEWVMVADGYSLDIDMVGTYHQRSEFKLEGGNGLKFTIDLGGDASPVFQCRMSRREALVCLGTPYYSGVEFTKMRVNCEPLVTPGQERVCTPYK